jgi:TrmH family RNA methyltransferase
MERTTPHAPITSKENKAVRYLVSLSDPKVRKKEKAFLIEGIRMVEEALRDKLGVKQVIAAPSLTQHHGKGVLKLAEHHGVELLWISERLLDSISDSKTPQPVMAVVEMREHSEESLLAHSSGLIVIAHHLQDPGNLGTIIRTAEAVGASGVAITPHTVDAYNSKAVRGSMGSILRVPVVRIQNEHAFVETCKERGFQAAALVLNGRETPFELDLTVPTVIMLGQESSGLMAEELVGFDHRIRIPMAETIDSLNVATSATVVLYEALRQRMMR